MLFTDPKEWYLDLQVIHDIITSGRSSYAMRLCHGQPMSVDGLPQMLSTFVNGLSAVGRLS